MNHTDAFLGILSHSGGREGVEQSAMTTYLSNSRVQDAGGVITIAPAVSPANIISPIDIYVHLGVTVTVSVLVAMLFLGVYVQLMMVLCFGYKLISYQTVLLFDILIWAALRLTLYSFYFRCCGLIKQLNIGWGWLLVAFPSALQYISLAILVHYFGENLFKVYERRQEMSSLVPPYKRMRKYRLLAQFIWFASILVFIAGNITFYILIECRQNQQNDLLVLLRVILLDGLFFVMGILLGLCIILIYTTRAGKDVQEAQGVHKCWPLLISFLLILLFTSRTIYDLVAVKVEDAKQFGFGWTFATDMGDFEFENTDNHYGYIAYLAVLVIWEVIPTYLIVIFFRIRMPSASVLIPKRENTADNRKHFFDNPRRYDDESEPLTSRSIKRSRMANGSTGQVSIPSLPDPSQMSGIYGAYGSTSSRQNPYSAPSKYSVNNHVGSGSAMSNYMPGTTPPQLFTSPSFLSDR